LKACRGLTTARADSHSGAGKCAGLLFQVSELARRRRRILGLGACASDIHGDPLDLNNPDDIFMSAKGVLFATDANLVQKIKALNQPNA
jgi:hypothetical protein